jgi:transposase-like protein
MARLAVFKDNSESDVLAYMDFPQNQWSKIYSTNPLERLNKEVKRRNAVVGIFPCNDSIVRLIGAMLMEQNDEWLLQDRYMPREGRMPCLW